MMRFVKVINDATWDRYEVQSGTGPQHNSCSRVLSLRDRVKRRRPQIRSLKTRVASPDSFALVNLRMRVGVLDSAVLASVSDS